MIPSRNSQTLTVDNFLSQPVKLGWVFNFHEISGVLYGNCDLNRTNFESGRQIGFILKKIPVGKRFGQVNMLTRVENNIEN